MPVDDIDRKILAQLTQNGRMTLAAVGERIGLSSPAVKRRVDRLEREGTIRGYSAVIDHAAVGWDTEAFLEVYCERTASIDLLRDAFAEVPEVIGAYTVAGDAEAIVHVRTASMAQLEQTIERIHRQPSVVRTKTQVVLTTLVER